MNWEGSRSAGSIGPLQAGFYFVIIAVTIGLLTTPYYHFAWLPVVAVLLAILLGRYPKVGFYIILFIVPLETFSGLQGYQVTLTIPRVVGLWIIIVLGFQIVMRRRKVDILKSDFWILFSLFLFSAIISALLSDYFATSVDNIKRIAVSYTFFAMALLLITKKDFFKTIPSIIIWSVSISSLLSVIDYLFDLSLFTLLTGGAKREAGGAGDPNEFASMIIFALPLLTSWLFQSKNTIIKPISVILIFINLTALILTYSRGGGILLVILAGLLFFDNMKRFRARDLGAFIAVLSFILVLGTALTPKSYIERMQTASKVQSSNSISSRLSFVSAGWDAFKERPFFGFGPGAFRDYYTTTDYARSFAKTTETGEFLFRRAAHNSYIEILAGQGLTGLLIFLLIMYFAIRNFGRAIKIFEEKGDKSSAMIVGAYRISFITMTFALLILSFYFNRYFWIGLALSQMALVYSRRLSESPWQNPRATIGQDVS